MTEIVILCRGGVVQSVHSDYHEDNIHVDVIDCDELEEDQEDTLEEQLIGMKRIL